MRVGVLGATGMLGYHAAVALTDMGHQVVVLHRPGSSLQRVASVASDTRTADVDDPASLRAAFDGLDGVIHSAAYYPTLPRPLEDDIGRARNQMQGFLDALRDAEVPRAVYVGGSIAIPRREDGQPADESGIYPQAPLSGNPYVQCKWLMDHMARAAGGDEGLPISIAIPGMTMGDHDFAPSTGQIIVGIISGLMARYVEGRRNVIYAGDAGRGIARVLEAGAPGQRYLLTGENTDMSSLVQRIAGIAGCPAPSPVPLLAARAIGRLQTLRYRFLGGPPPVISSTAIAVMSAGQHLDGSRAEKELSFRAEVGVDEALSRAIDWFRDNGYLER